MKRTRSLLSLALALLLVCSLGAGVFAADYPESGFADVPRDKWYAKAVDFVKDAGLMNGVGDNLFRPEGEVTRAMVVTVLYRLSEEPDVSGVQTQFTDLRAGSYYENAVLWAASTGVTKGVTETAFEPDTAITREQMATMIIRYSIASSGDDDAIADAQKLDPDGKVVLQLLSNGVSPELAAGFPAVGNFTGFADAASISNYARWYVLFCRLTGIMKGDADGHFRPGDTLSRAECAQTFLNISELGESALAQ